MHKVEDVLGAGPHLAWPEILATKCISSARGTATNTTSKPANARPTGGCGSSPIEVVRRGEDIYVRRR